MELALVEPLALSHRRQVEHVRVVRDQHEPALDGAFVDRDPQRLTVREQNRPCADARERLATSPVLFASMHELRVETERDVVEEQTVTGATDVDAPLAAVERAQRIDRVVAIEAEVACEVVARAERNADEGAVTLDRDGRDRRKRPVAARDPEDVRAGRARDLRGVVALLQDCGSIPRVRASATSSSALGESLPERGLTRSRPAKRSGNVSGTGGGSNWADRPIVLSGSEADIYGHE